MGRGPLVITSIAASIALIGIGCRERSAAPVDAGSDGSKGEVANPLTLVVAVTGCATYQAAGGCGDAADAPCCTGAPPLTLSFTPVGSPELTRFLWDFGDGTATTTERAPTHTYAHPDTYQVQLVGGSTEVGMISPPRALQVSVRALAAGVPCDVDAQCDRDDGLACLCAPGSGCAAAFTRGLCSRSCDSAACGVGAVCAALTVGPSPDASARPPLCIAGCQTTAQCPAGYVCQTVRAGAAGAGAPWTSGCLPLGAARDLGSPCRDADDRLSDDACATGTCADVGALGACSAACDDSRPCPPRTLCAALSGGRQLCLRSGCTTDADCGPDPLLACQPSAPSTAQPAVTVCAPKPCTGDATCAPSGRCGPDGVCVRR